MTSIRIDPSIKFYLARALRILPSVSADTCSYRLVLECRRESSSRPPTTREWLFSTVAISRHIGIPWLDQLEHGGDPSRLEPRHRAPVLPRGSLHSDAPTCGFALVLLLALIALRLSLLDHDFTLAFHRRPERIGASSCLALSAHRLGTPRPGGPDSARSSDGLPRPCCRLQASSVGYPSPLSLDRPELWLFYLMFAASIPFIFSISMRSRIDRFLGDLSYPIYVAHWFVISFVGHFSGTLLSICALRLLS